MKYTKVKVGLNCCAFIATALAIFFISSFALPFEVAAQVKATPELDIQLSGDTDEAINLERIDFTGTRTVSFRNYHKCQSNLAYQFWPSIIQIQTQIGFDFLNWVIHIRTLPIYLITCFFRL